jgi:hypothetical protein
MKSQGEAQSRVRGKEVAAIAPHDKSSAFNGPDGLK